MEINNLPTMNKIILILLGLILTVNATAQNDTIIYFSKLNYPISNIKEAIRYEKLTMTAKNKYTLSTFLRGDDEWSNSTSFLIDKINDTVYNWTTGVKISRQINKLDSGYIIKDFNNSVLQDSGFSYTIFPLIKSGKWVTYNLLTKKKDSECYYRNNQEISNNYWFEGKAPINNIFTYFEIPPRYDGGDNALMRDIFSLLNYPEAALNRNIQGTVLIRFVILEDGTIKNPRVINEVNKLLAKEALRVLSLLPKKWIPGVIDNKKVKSFFAVPITFRFK